jgi:hypothetical protein
MLSCGFCTVNETMCKTAESKAISSATSADVISALQHYGFTLLDGDKEEPLPEPMPGASLFPELIGAEYHASATEFHMYHSLGVYDVWMGILEKESPGCRTGSLNVSQCYHIACCTVVYNRL